MIVTLLTDFGQRDYFVGSMKGAILSSSPSSQIIDITHDIPPQDIHAAAFNLLCAYKSFPAQTIHLAIVDPGVGSFRRAIVVRANEQFFVGPDNGVFSYVLDRETKARVNHVTREDLFQRPISSTFHGRDVFAPIAAAVANGLNPKELGEQIHDYVRLDSLAPRKLANGVIEGRIINIDRFGNLVTNIARTDFAGELGIGKFRLCIAGRQIMKFRDYYSAESDSSSEPFLIWGSAGFIEIAVRNASAARELEVKNGDVFRIETE
jgi:hypothetical protein